MASNTNDDAFPLNVVSISQWLNIHTNHSQESNSMKYSCNQNNPSSSKINPLKKDIKDESISISDDDDDDDDDAIINHSILPLIDLRNKDDYQSKHIYFPNHWSYKKSTIVNLPLESLISGERSCELPPRNLPFAILIPKTNYLISNQDCNPSSSSSNVSISINDGSHHISISSRIINHTIPAQTNTKKSKICKNLDINIDQSILTLFLSTQSQRTQQSRCRWNIKQILLESDDLWNHVTELDLLGPIKSKNYIHHSYTSIMHTDIEFPLPRLWKPDPLMESYIIPLLFRFLQNHILHTFEPINKYKRKSFQMDHNLDIDASMDPKDISSFYTPTDITHTFPYQVWDLGSGAGRDICFLAEECLSHHYYHQNMSFISNKQMEPILPPVIQNSSTSTSTSNQYLFPIQFIGIDNHKGSAKRCLPLWKNRMVQSITKSMRLDLKKMDLVHDILSSSIQNDKGSNAASKSTTIQTQAKCNVILVYAIRYLNRHLIQYLVSDKCPLMKGTLFAMSHFCKPTMKSEWNFDHPKVCHFQYIYI